MNRAGRARADRTSAATPSTSRGRTESSPSHHAARRRSSATGIAARRLCASNVPCPAQLLRSLAHSFQPRLLNFRAGDFNQLAPADEFPGHHAAREKKRSGLLPHSLIFSVSQRFDQPLCRRPPAWKGRDDDAGTTGGEIALEGVPDISTVARGNERSRQRLAY